MLRCSDMSTHPLESQPRMAAWSVGRGDVNWLVCHHGANSRGIDLLSTCRFAWRHGPMNLTEHISRWASGGPRRQTRYATVSRVRVNGSYCLQTPSHDTTCARNGWAERHQFYIQSGYISRYIIIRHVDMNHGLSISVRKGPGAGEACRRRGIDGSRRDCMGRLHLRSPRQGTWAWSEH